MMVALLAIERGGLDEVGVVSRAASRETGTRIGLKAGDSLRARDLLAATVVRSANDACRALAERNGVRVLLVMLNASNRWWHAVNLFNRAFEEPPQ